MPLYNEYQKQQGLQTETWLEFKQRGGFGSLLLNDDIVSDDVAGAIFDGKIVETLDGATSVELNFLDTTRTLIKGLLKNWMQVGPAPIYTVHTGRQRRKITLPQDWNDVYLTLDGRDFCLCGVKKNGDEFDLTFENRAVHELRRYRKQKSWQRTDTFTRAMCIKAMCDEVTTLPGGIQFFTNELRKKQPIGQPNNTGTNPTSPPSAKDTKAQAAAKKQHGFAPNAPVTVKHAKATAQQKDYISQVLRTGESMSMPYACMVSAIMCITQESDVSILNNPTLGMGLFSQEKYISGQRSPWPAMDNGIAGDATAYFNSCLHYYKSNPSQPLASLVQDVQGSGAGASYYAQWESEAKETMKYWGTSEGSAGSSTTATFNQIDPYYFKRGTNQGAEDSWTCMQRLAGEVKWRCFAVDNVIYYEDDDTLFSSIPIATISEGKEGIDAINYDVDTGKIVSEVQVAWHSLRWDIRAGACVMIDGEGTVDGRWLVYEVDHPLFSDIANVTLHLPTPAIKEPAPTTSQVTVKGQSFLVSKSGKSLGVTSTGNSIIDKAVAKAKEIDAQHYPYSYGGGHGSFNGPYDCSGLVSAILNAAGVLNTPMASGALNGWGQAGRGKQMTVWTNPNPGPTGHAYIEFDLPTASGGHMQANTSHVSPPSWGSAFLPWGGPGEIDTHNSLFHPRHWPGT